MFASGRRLRRTRSLLGWPALRFGLIFVLKGSMETTDLELLRKWIDLNLHVVLKHWHGDLASREVIAAVRRI